jgi:threonine/homoserine/homoserine lactone efflux protein
LYEALRWAGVLYLFWLAWEAWRRQEDKLAGTVTMAHDSKYFLRGLVTNLLNPKAGIFYLAVLPTFVNESRPLLAQTITLSAIYVAVATAVHSAVVLLADTARPWLEDQERSVIIRRVFSLLLVAIAIWLLFATQYKPPRLVGAPILSIEFALHMSAFDPKRTLSSGTVERYVRYNSRPNL